MSKQAVAIASLRFSNKHQPLWSGTSRRKVSEWEIRKLQLLTIPLIFLPQKISRLKKVLCSMQCYRNEKWQAIVHSSNEKKYKTGVINDPLGQTHNLASTLFSLEICFCFAIFWKVGTDGRTDNMCEYNDHYWPWLWVGRVDQKYKNMKRKSGKC